MKSTESCITKRALPTLHRQDKYRPAVGGWLRLRREFQFNNFVGFVGSWLPLPLAQRVLGRLNKKGVAALHFEGLHLPARSNQHICTYVALYSQRAGEAWILRNCFRNNFPTALRDFLGTCGAGDEQKWEKNKQSNYHPILHGDKFLHRRNSSTRRIRGL
jgi:hypothetical protein